MPAITDAMRKANDEEFRREYNRELYGSDIDDYMRNLTGKESYYDQEARERKRKILDGLREEYRNRTKISDKSRSAVESGNQYVAVGTNAIAG